MNYATRYPLRRVIASDRQPYSDTMTLTLECGHTTTHHVAMYGKKELQRAPKKKRCILCPPKPAQARP